MNQSTIGSDSSIDSEHKTAAFKDLLYELWRCGRDGIDRYEAVQIVMEAHEKEIAREKQAAIETATKRENDIRVDELVRMCRAHWQCPIPEQAMLDRITELSNNNKEQ